MSQSDSGCVWELNGRLLSPLTPSAAVAQHVRSPNPLPLPPKNAQKNHKPLISRHVRICVHCTLLDFSSHFSQHACACSSSLRDLKLIPCTVQSVCFWRRRGADSPHLPPHWTSTLHAHAIAPILHSILNTINTIMPPTPPFAGVGWCCLCPWRGSARQTHEPVQISSLARALLL
jgi:hypothetical protein